MNEIVRTAKDAAENIIKKERGNHLEVAIVALERILGKNGYKGEDLLRVLHQVRDNGRFETFFATTYNEEEALQQTIGEFETEYAEKIDGEGGVKFDSRELATEDKQRLKKRGKEEWKRAHVQRALAGNSLEDYLGSISEAINDPDSIQAITDAYNEEIKRRVKDLQDRVKDEKNPLTYDNARSEIARENSSELSQALLSALDETKVGIQEKIKNDNLQKKGRQDAIVASALGKDGSLDYDKLIKSIQENAAYKDLNPEEKQQVLARIQLLREKAELDKVGDELPLYSDRPPMKGEEALRTAEDNAATMEYDAEKKKNRREAWKSNIKWMLKGAKIVGPVGLIIGAGLGTAVDSLPLASIIGAVAGVGIGSAAGYIAADRLSPEVAEAKARDFRADANRIGKLIDNKDRYIQMRKKALARKKEALEGESSAIKEIFGSLNLA